MQCPYCKVTVKNTRVIDTRETPDGIRRRRQCEQCDQRFTTYERIATINLMVIKSDKRREEFNKEKLIKSIQIACTKRPISSQEIQQAAETIEETLYDLGKNEVSSAKIGEMIMAYLKEVDDIAYVRFASVYRSFQDVDSLAAEIEQLLAEKRRDSLSARQHQADLTTE